MIIKYHIVTKDGKCSDGEEKGAVRKNGIGDKGTSYRMGRKVPLRKKQFELRPNWAFRDGANLDQ